MMRGNCLVIPGSSWKGIFRHRCDVILRWCQASDEQRTHLMDWLFGTPERPGALVFASAVVPAGTPREQTHIAIDRFTGGVIDGGLYMVASIPRSTPLRQDIGLVSGAELPPEVQNLLTHVAGDIHDGLIGVGGGGGRGYGWLTLPKTTLQARRPVDVQVLAKESTA